MAWFSMQSLQEICVRNVAYSYPKFETQFSYIPESIKDRLLTLLLKRRRLSSQTVSTLLNRTLRRIDLSSVVMTIPLFQKLAKCKYLTYVNLNGDRNIRNDVTDEGILAMVQGCIGLRNVQLRNCVLITDRAVVALVQHCRRLENINLYSCYRISDRSLQALATNSPNLMGINLVKTKVTDKGLYSLSKSPCSQTLKEIQLDGCKYVSNKSIEMLSVACPKLYLFTFSNCSNSANWMSTCKVSADVMFFTVQ